MFAKFSGQMVQIGPNWSFQIFTNQNAWNISDLFDWSQMTSFREKFLYWGFHTKKNKNELFEFFWKLSFFENFFMKSQEHRSCKLFQQNFFFRFSGQTTSNWVQTEFHDKLKLDMYLIFAQNYSIIRSWNCLRQFFLGKKSCFGFFEPKPSKLFEISNYTFSCLKLV